MPQDGKKSRRGRGRRWLRRALLGLGALVLLVLLGAGVLYLVLDQPPPQVDPSSDSEAKRLADRVMRAYGHDAWLRTGAVRWTFRGAHRHLWDRRRGFARVRWGGRMVLLDLRGRARSRAYRSGSEVTAPTDRQAMVRRAYAMFINDSYWLNPLRGLRDRGVTLRMARDAKGQRGLLVRYGRGGVTPGDSYLWFIDDQSGRPRAFRMWVSILPIGGLRVSWAGWRRLSTGAWISTRHAVGPLTLELTGVQGAATLGKLASPDPFASLAR